MRPLEQWAGFIGAMNSAQTCESAFDSPAGVYGGFYAIRRELATRQRTE